MTARVAIVGAGPAGLCAARHSLAAGFEVTVFEQSGAVGGTWQYTDTVGEDSYGVPVHTSMYKNLRTNVPKDVVVFPGFPHKESEHSYITSEEVLQYLNDYADQFHLQRHCKFNHRVKVIRRTLREWEVTVVDLPNSSEHTYTFEALFICNGVNNRPYTPYVEGSEHFTGRSLHSHDYREADSFTGQRVLIIGGGPSGLDLTDHISRCADKFSTRLKQSGDIFIIFRADREAPGLKSDDKESQCGDLRSQIYKDLRSQISAERRCY